MLRVFKVLGVGCWGVRVVESWSVESVGVLGLGFWGIRGVVDVLGCWECEEC